MLESDTTAMQLGKYLFGELMEIAVTAAPLL